MRIARAEHIPTLREISEFIYNSGYPYKIPEYILTISRFIRVVGEGDTLIAYVWYYWADEDNGLLEFHAASSATVDWLSLGHSLLTHAKAIPGARALTAEPIGKHKASLGRLLRRLGFEECPSEPGRMYLSWADS